MSGETSAAVRHELVWAVVPREDDAPWYRCAFETPGLAASIGVFPPMRAAGRDWSLLTGVMLGGVRVDTVVYFAERPTDEQVRAEIAVVVALHAHAAALRASATQAGVMT